MIKILNEKNKRTIESIDKEYPNSKYVIALDNPLDELVYLCVVSTDSSEHSELCDEFHKLCKENSDIYYSVAGSYNNGGSLYVQYEVEEK